MEARRLIVYREITMRKEFFIVVLSLVVAVACCPCRKAGTASAVVDRDSVYVTRYDTLRIVERDTLVLRPLPPAHDAIITESQYSQLENAYSTTSAEIDAEGRLRHTLDTKDNALLPVRVERVEHIVRDTVVRWHVDKRTEVSVKEIRKATWWQRTQIVALWVLLGILAIAYRKKILSLLKRIILWI